MNTPAPSPAQTHWEDFDHHTHYDFGTYHLTEKEIIGFGKKYDPLPHHINPEQAAKTSIGTLCASGIQAVGIAHKLLCEHLFLKSALVAGKGFQEMQMHKPIIPGSRLRVMMQVIDKQSHKYQSDRGWVTFHVKLYNQNQETLMTYRSIILFLKRTPK